MAENAKARKCDHPGCDESGEYRAPKSRAAGDYYWFCLKHVAEYNKSWNYYDGMSAEEVERENRRDEAWQAQTFKFGLSLDEVARGGGLDDPFEIYDRYMKGRAKPKAKIARVFSKDERAALKLFEIEWPFAQKDLKARYKKLARAHHPDLNRGSKESEEKFKDVAAAYAVLLKMCSTP
jgi:curved DNA-binding protein CbpA